MTTMSKTRRARKPKTQVARDVLDHLAAPTDGDTQDRLIEKAIDNFEGPAAEVRDSTTGDLPTAEGTPDPAEVEARHDAPPHEAPAPDSTTGDLPAPPLPTAEGTPGTGEVTPGTAVADLPTQAAQALPGPGAPDTDAQAHEPAVAPPTEGAAPPAAEAPAFTVVCPKCRGTGKYRFTPQFAGAAPIDGRCNQCRGHGVQTADDLERNRGYGTYTRGVKWVVLLKAGGRSSSREFSEYARCFKVSPDGKPEPADVGALAPGDTVLVGTPARPADKAPRTFLPATVTGLVDKRPKKPF